MCGKHLFLLVLCLCAITKSIYAMDEDREDDLEPDAEDANEPVSCPSEFKNRCSCGRFTIKAPDGKAYRRFVTNCTNTGFGDANVLRALPVDTQILIFTGNN